MSDFGEICALLSAGEAWRAAEFLVGLSDGQFDALTQCLVDEAADRAALLAVLRALVEAPQVPCGTAERDRLLRLEGMRVLAAAVAHSAVEQGWRDLTGAVKALAADESYRVREMTVRLVTRIASGAFAETSEFWRECLATGDAGLVAAVLRGLAASDAPAGEVLGLFSAVMSDIRREVRHSLGAKAIPGLGRREPQAVFAKLKGWARETDEITRWNVAQALATPLGGVYAEDAVEILECFAADERGAVWRAAAAALVHIAQRRPAFVLPILKRWHDDPARCRCARLAFAGLARR